MNKRLIIKSLIITALLTFLFGMAGMKAYAAESGAFDGEWKCKTTTGSSFILSIKNNRTEAFTAPGWGYLWDFPAAEVDLEKDCLIAESGYNSFVLNFDTSDTSRASGSMIGIPDDNHPVGGWTVVEAENANPKNPKITYLNKTLWKTILPDLDKKLSESLACLNDMTWNGKTYVIVGRGKILTSKDGVSWKTAHSMENNHALYGVVWSGKEFTAIGTDESDNTAIVLKSADGEKWKETELNINGYMLDIAYNGKMYAAVGDPGVLITSADGLKWTAADIYATSMFTNIIWADNKFVAVGNDVIAISSDGISWKMVAGQTGEFRGLVYYKEQFCIVDNSGRILITKDFKKWETKQVSLSQYSYVDNAACSKDSIYLAVSNKGCVLSSSDLDKWTQDPLTNDKDASVYINNIVYVNGRYYLVGPQYISFYEPPAASDTGTDKEIEVIINGSKVKLTQEPYLSGDVLMLPVKAVLEKAGLTVKISGSKLTVTRGTKVINLAVNSASAVMGKKKITLEAKVVTKGGVAYAPLEKIVEALGGTFTWDAGNNKVTIKFSK